jgi:hypothetical protein
MILYQGLADAQRSPAPEFLIGSQVFIKAEYFHSMQPSKKLSEKNLGPFEVIAQVGTHSLTLCLPDSMHTVHPVFHVSQTAPTTPNTILN